MADFTEKLHMGGHNKEEGAHPQYSYSAYGDVPPGHAGEATAVPLGAHTQAQPQPHESLGGHKELEGAHRQYSYQGASPQYSYAAYAEVPSGHAGEATAVPLGAHTHAQPHPHESLHEHKKERGVHPEGAYVQYSYAAYVDVPPGPAGEATAVPLGAHTQAQPHPHKSLDEHKKEKGVHPQDAYFQYSYAAHVDVPPGPAGEATAVPLGAHTQAQPQPHENLFDKAKHKVKGAGKQGDGGSSSSSESDGEGGRRVSK